jgi:hypothetical protein
VTVVRLLLLKEIILNLGIPGPADVAGLKENFLKGKQDLMTCLGGISAELRERRFLFP